MPRPLVRELEPYRRRPDGPNHERKTGPRHSPPESSESAPSAPTRTNIEAVLELERDTRSDRTALQRLTDVVSATASSTGFIVTHVIWFSAWVVLNVFLGHRFDPYPFSLLTLVVSLEAILLTGLF